MPIDSVLFEAWLLLHSGDCIMDFNIPTYQDIKKVCEEKNMTIQEVVDKAGMTRMSLWYWENGKEPTLCSIRKLFQVLHNIK